LLSHPSQISIVHGITYLRANLYQQSFQQFKTQHFAYSIMSDNVGLNTPRGSGTSGYVQRNLAQIKPRDYGAPYPKDLDSLRHKQRQPDKGILEHDRKREVEVKVFDLRDKLEEEEYRFEYIQLQSWLC
jgi:hypothetical protein